jgi:hypothetical protein
MKKALFHHFEKGVLAVFAALLLAIVAGPLFARPAEIDGREQLVALEAKVETCLAATDAQVPPVNDELSKLRANLDAPAPMDRLPSWLIHRRPNIGIGYREKERLPDGVHDSPSFTEVTSDHGVVTLRWAPSPKDDCVIIGYEVLRRDVAGNVQTFTPKKDETTLVDRGVAASTTYVYTLRETAEAPPGYNALPESLATLSIEREVKVPRDVIIIVDRDPSIDPFGQPEWIKLTIATWKNGGWVKKEFQQVFPKNPATGKTGAIGPTGAVLEKIVPVTPGKLAQVTVRWPDGRVEILASNDVNSELAPPSGPKH